MPPIDETGQGADAGVQKTDQQLQRLSELRVRTREYSNDLRVLASAGRDTGEILARAFTGAALRGKDLSDSFRSVILSLSQKTLRSAANSFSGAVTSGLGNLFGGMMRNANGNAFSQGRVIPLARGGVVSGPSIFPMSGGVTGLMGEAGPEAIVPVSAQGGGFAAIGVLSSGQEISVSLTRNAAGKLAIQVPDAPAPTAALASEFAYSTESHVSQAFAAGGIVNQGNVLPIHAYAYGGVANKPQVAVFGEGSMNEAFVPLPDGKSIPVTLEDSGKGGGDIYITQNISTPDVAGFARTKNQMANELRSALGSASRRA